MEPKIDLAQKILKRNNFNLELTNENTYKIEQDRINSRNINLYYLLGIVIIGIGGLVLFAGSLWGIVILVASVPVFNKVSKQKKREKENYGSQIIINKNQLQLHGGNLNMALGIDDIEEFHYKVDRDKNISSGTILVRTNEGEDISILEIFGDNKKYLEDDTKLLVQFFIDVINADG